MVKISVDKNRCIGCGACVATCENFSMKDGKAFPKKSEVEKITCEKNAAESCPVDAISIK